MSQAGRATPDADGLSDADGADVVSEVAEGVDRALAGLVDVDLDRLASEQIDRLVGVNERAIRRLEAHRSRLAATLSQRAVQQARAERPGDRRAGERAARRVRNELVDHHRLTPSEAKQAVRSGRQLQSLPVAAAAARAGDLSAAHGPTTSTGGEDPPAHQARDGPSP